MEPEQESKGQVSGTAPESPQPLGPSPAVREVLYRALALGLVIVIGVAIVLIAAVSLIAGLLPPVNTGAAVSPAPSSAVTTAIPATITLPPTTAPIDLLPPGSEVSVTIEPKSSSGLVLIRFDGGPGRNLVKTIETRLTTPDGSVVTGSMDPHTITPQVTMQGSRGTDRVEVFAILYSGKVYKITDQAVPYFKRF